MQYRTTAARCSTGLLWLNGNQQRQWSQLVPSSCGKGLEEDPQCPPQPVLVLRDGVVPEEDQFSQDTPAHHTATQQQLGKPLPHCATQESTLRDKSVVQGWEGMEERETHSSVNDSSHYGCKVKLEI